MLQPKRIWRTSAHYSSKVVIKKFVQPLVINDSPFRQPAQSISPLNATALWRYGDIYRHRQQHYLHRMFSALEEMSPLLERANDREHLLVVDLVVALDVVEAFREKGYRMPLLVQAQLREHRAGRKVRAVRLQAIRPGGVREN